MLDTILTTKVAVPPARAHLIGRSRLIAILNDGLQRKCTVLAAPAGFGKSTLLAEWANQSPTAVAWINLEPGDDEFERFLGILVSAFQLAAPALDLSGAAIASQLSMQSITVGAVKPLLINRLAQWSQPLTLFLDDYHLISNPQICELTTALIDHSPTTIHYVLACRSDPPLPLSRWRVESQLQELDESDLRFSHAEAMDFFQQAMPLDLSSEQVLSLLSRTEGWVAGLQLAGLSLQRRSDPDSVIAGLSGAHRYILDYLGEEVMRDLPESTQDFLLRVSILERLTGDLCDAVVAGLGQSAAEAEGSGAPIQSPPAAQMLEDLDAHNLFIVALDDERRWYRFHQLFRDFLLDRLSRLTPELIPELHRHAAAWHARAGYAREAIRHALQAGDPSLAADWIDAEAERQLVSGELSTLLGWIEELPVSVRMDRPQLEMKYWFALLMREPQRFMRDHQSIMASLADRIGLGDDPVAGFAASEPGSRQRLTLCQWMLLHGYSRRDFDPHAQSLQRFQLVLDHLPPEELFLRGFALAGLGSVHGRAGDVAAAERAFREAAQISRAGGSLYGYIAAKDWQCVTLAHQAKFGEALRGYQDLLEHLPDPEDATLPLTGHVYVGLADILLEQNDLGAVEKRLLLGIRVGEQVSDTDALLIGYRLLGRLRAAQGDLQEAREALDRAIALARNVGAAACVNETEAQWAGMNLAAGDLPQAERWASSRPLAEAVSSGEGAELEESEWSTYARLLLAQGERGDALKITERLLDRAESDGRLRSAIEFMLLRALILQADGDRDGAQTSLARALLLAEPSGFTRSFLDGGAPMAALLRSTAAAGHSPNYVERLLSAFGSDHPSGDKLEPLSERELQVLRLAADGLTNAQIAAELIIAQSTVKTHINRIYAKLGVRSRTQAVARGRKMGLIS